MFKPNNNDGTCGVDVAVVVKQLKQFKRVNLV